MNAACSGLCACHREAKCFLSSRYADTPAAASRCGGTAEGRPSRAAKMGPNMVRAPRGREGRTREGRTCGPRRGSRRRSQHEASSRFAGARYDAKRRCGDISRIHFCDRTPTISGTHAPPPVLRTAFYNIGIYCSARRLIPYHCAPSRLRAASGHRRLGRGD